MKRMLGFQAEKIAALAQHDFRFERQLPEQCGTEPRPRSRFANHKRAGSTHVHDIELAQFPCQDARAKRPVSADIDTSKEDNESHTGIMNGNAGRATAATLLPEPLEAVRELRTFFSLVRELCDEQRERLRVTGDP